MAMIDYGAIAFRDGVCIQKDYFMSMKDAVGYTVEGIKGNFFHLSVMKNLHSHFTSVDLPSLRIKIIRTTWKRFSLIIHISLGGRSTQAT